LRRLLEAIFQIYHHDFRGYSATSMRRRFAMAMVRLGWRSLAQLSDEVLSRPAAFAALLGFLTVQVSDMFRDPAFFLALRARVVPLLRTHPSLKLWVAGCSAGEEAYSMAVLLAEEGLLDRSLIYATDINGSALQQAEAGVYAIERAAGFADNHIRSGARTALSQYYCGGDGYIRFSPALQEHIVFADHSLATDAVFSEVQLVSCRNVLIYFERELQNRAVGLFREALCRGGFLGLGAKEALRFSAHAAAFAEIDRDNRIFQRMAGA
jgi:chemotaxis protein methyltransferase CheR